MGGHNRPSLSQRWVGVDGEQIVWKSGSCEENMGPALFAASCG